MVPRRSRVRSRCTTSCRARPSVAARGPRCAPDASSPSTTRSSTAPPPDSGPTRQGHRGVAGRHCAGAAWRVPAGTTADGGTGSLAVANFGAVDTEVEVRGGAARRRAPPRRRPCRCRRGAWWRSTSPARVPVDTDYAVVAAVAQRRRRHRAGRGRDAGVVAAVVVEHRAWRARSAPVRAARRWVVVATRRRRRRVPHRAQPRAAPGDRGAAAGRPGRPLGRSHQRARARGRPGHGRARSG